MQKSKSRSTENGRRRSIIFLSNSRTRCLRSVKTIRMNVQLSTEVFIIVYDNFIDVSSFTNRPKTLDASAGGRRICHRHIRKQESNKKYRCVYKASGYEEDFGTSRHRDTSEVNTSQSRFAFLVWRLGSLKRKNSKTSPQISSAS